MVTEKSTALPSAKILQPSISKDASASFDVSNDRAESGEGSEKGSGAGTGMEEGTGDGAGEAGGSGSGGPSFDTDAIQPDVSPTLLSGSAPNYPEAMRSRGTKDASLSRWWSEKMALSKRHRSSKVPAMALWIRRPVGSLHLCLCPGFIRKAYAVPLLCLEDLCLCPSH